MRKFHLLRDQQESGPYTLEELLALHPGPGDMVWVDGQSRSWRPAAEVRELHITEAGEAAALPDLDHEPALDRPLSTPKRRNKMNLVAWVTLGLFVLILGVMIVLYLSPDRKSPLPATGGLVVGHDSVEKPKDTVVKRPPKPVNIDVSDELTAEPNNFKIGFFGGIKALKVHVANHGNHLAEKIRIRAEYLKPNDEVIQSEESSLGSLAAGQSKDVDMPESQRGVKVRVSILRAQATIYVSDDSTSR